MVNTNQAVFIRLRAEGVGNEMRAAESSPTSSPIFTEPQPTSPLNESVTERTFAFSSSLEDHHLSSSSSSSMASPSFTALDVSYEWPSMNNLAQSAQAMIQSAYHFWEISTDTLAASHIDTKLLQQLSILLISAEFLRQRLVEALEEALYQAAETYGIASRDATLSPYATTTTVLEIDIVWLIPIFTAIASFSFFLSLMMQLQPTSHALVLIGLVSLALVECLVPIALTGCTALFWFDVVTAETALLLLFFVWVASAVSARTIRRCLYPNLGHG